MSHQDRCKLPPVEIEGSVTACAECGELYQACEGQGRLKWVRLDQIPEEERSVAYVEQAESEIPTRIDLVPYPVGSTAPLVLDMGSDAAIVIQPKPDQRDGEIALNIVVGGGLPADIVAFLLGKASEAMVKGIRTARLEQADKINGHDFGGAGQ